MALSFSLGVHQLWDELRIMQAPGLYWVSADREVDAKSFCQQVISSQPAETRAALISVNHPPQDIISANYAHGPDKLPIYSLPENKKALFQLTEDLMRGLNPKNRLLVLLTPSSIWEQLQPYELTDWMRNTARWLRQQNCTLLILDYGKSANNQRATLQSQHRTLCGLASLRWLQDLHRYDVAYWCNQNGVTAQQDVSVSFDEQGWHAQEDTSQAPQPRNDEQLYLAHKGVLEGAPPLSENWHLFESNLALFNAAYAAQASTLVFQLSNSDQLDALARKIHTLRRQRGKIIKLVVRESTPCLRFSDERLLLACGANLIVPHNAPLSRCLTMLEGIQGQTYPRHVPADINLLIDAMRPLNLKGYIPYNPFCETLMSLMNNALLPEDSKGILVALRPVPGLRAEQALTLCRARRFGDLVTIDENRLTLFLSSCRINDLDVALKHIFPLPVEEVFSNRMVWYQDKLIIMELQQMQLNKPSNWHLSDRLAPLVGNKSSPVAEERPPRHSPQPISLSLALDQERAE
ncbi:MAG: cellulose biosynthesis protein BcsE [Hafnia sp.]|uniref:cellulose biosynthesis protein BcsE n=1 Tax=Hafnia sp. TaxID=1873498 RepID=UPI002FC764DF